MKKQRQSSRQGPIQLSANKKSHSINLKTKQEPLFAPYKIEWKSPVNDNYIFNVKETLTHKEPLKNIQNGNKNNASGNSNSKAFYQNMKNELLNIKQDVQKLILKEKKNSVHTIEQNDFGANFYSISPHRGHSNGCIKTLSIKNKCQQKSSKIQNLYENVEKVLVNKMTEINSVSNKFTVGQSRFDHPTMHNLIDDQMKNACNLETKYRSEKDVYVRAKSKSIAQNFSKGFLIDLQSTKHNSGENKISIGSSLKFLQSDENQNHGEQNVQEEYEEVKKPKLEVEIKLPSFDKLKDEQKAANNQKSKLIQKLQIELNQLEKQLSQKDELMSLNQKCKLQLTEEIEMLKKQSHSNNIVHCEELKKYQDQIDCLRGQNQENSNKAKFYQQELQKAIHAIRQKEQENYNILQNLNSKNITIQELSVTCEQLSTQVKEMKQSLEQSRNIKEKHKLKESQLYIYQQELKQAKAKIKDLKQQLQSYSGTFISKETYVDKKTIQEQQETLDQTSKLSWELKQAKKLYKNLKEENQRIKHEFHSINQINSESQSKITRLVRQNTILKDKISQFQRNSQQAVQQLLNSPDFQSIGNEISKKLSMMVDENYQLKNKMSHLEANLEEITLRNRALTEQLKIYEEKASMLKDCTRRLKVQDWDNLTQERDTLKNELQSVKVRFQETKQFYQIETMRKENQIHELKQQIEEMTDVQNQNEQQFHPNVRSVKHIKNLNSLLCEFKEMIEYNLELKQEISKLQE